MTDEWGRVVEGGEFVKPSQLNGHLVIVYPIGYIPFIQTKFSGQSGKPSDGIAVDVVDLDDKDEQGLPGKVYRNSNFMQAQLIGALKTQIGSKVLGVIGQGVARNGMNPPWVIVDMSGDPMARERASAWLQANPTFRPSPFIVREPMAPQPQTVQGPAGHYGAPPAQQPYQQPPAQQPYQPPAQQPYQQAPAQPQPNYTLNSMASAAPAQPQQQQPYAGVPGAAQLSQEDMTVLQHHRQQRLLAEQEAARQATFNDTPPF